ncbi:MAG: hypothetical protein JSV49_00790 [Thermoplasmata archaeon]|nr:MAG: hypothetical protein JSV49_00790 [Thermoplasmata archaeon]
MTGLKWALLTVLLCLILIFPAQISYSSDPVYQDDYADESNPREETSKDAEITRSSSPSRNNMVKEFTDPISMPKVEGSWNQSNWSGGPNQIIWEDPSKYNSSSNLVYSPSDGHLELETGGEIEVWENLGDGPTELYRHSMVWCPSEKVFLIFGGYISGVGTSNNLYEYNPETDAWKQISHSNPPPARTSAIMVWDSVNNQLWVHGGRDSSWDLLNDLWCYSPTTKTWTPKSGGMGARSYSGGAFNPVTQQIIVYGGYIGDFYNASNDVFIYNVQTDMWAQMKDYIPRFYHDAIWCPKTNSMMVYGGCEGYTSGSGYDYVWELNEYFPNNDTWVNHSGVADRNRPIMAWDTYNKKIVITGGYKDGYRNETWWYDIDSDTWEPKLRGPPPRDYAEGDWDTIHNKLVIFGGYSSGGWRKDYWGYSPNASAYVSPGELSSSIYHPRYRMNLQSVSFGVYNPAPTHVGSNPVKIQLAGSDDSPENADSFIGPNGKTNTYFDEKNGEATPAVLDGSKYLAYNVQISTGNPLYTPKLKWVNIDYYTYPDSYTKESDIIDLGEDLGLPLRLVNWTSTEPEGTNLEIYFRQSSNSVGLNSLSWEKVIKEQSEFGYKGGRYLQYKAVLSTTEPGYTPVLETIKFTFNAIPTKPTPVLPLNNSWVGDRKPTLKWEFHDPDPTDYQIGFELNIALEDDFKTYAYSKALDSTDNSFKIDSELEEKTYYWRVRLRDNYGSKGPWSDIYIFKIDTAKPEPPQIQCYSHPLESIWYNKNRAVFDWNEPKDTSGIAGYSYIIDTSLEVEPENTTILSTEEFRLAHNGTSNPELIVEEELTDGIWYFHVKAVDNMGTWSDKDTKVIRIDTTPPSVKDETPAHVTAGAAFLFKFNLNDTDSGINQATINWRYSTDLDYQYDVLSKDEKSGKSMLNYQLENRNDPYLEFYLSVTDKSDPVNEIRYPASGHKRINIVDNIPPEIHNVTGDISQNRYTNLVITVEVTDNVGISEVTVYFNDQTTGRTMTESSDGKYSINIDRVELVELAEYTGGDRIYYKIEVSDFRNNSVTVPEKGNYNITLLADDDGKGSDTSKDSEDKLFSGSFMVNLIILIIVFIIVGIIVFIFIKKQTKVISEDRHKLRMAIAEAEEAAAAKKTEQEIASLSAAPGLQPGAEIPPAPMIGGIEPHGAELPALGPGPGPEMQQGVPRPGEYVYGGEDLTTQPRARDYDQVSSQPPQTDVPDEVQPKKSDLKKKEAVDIGDGFSVSLPGEEAKK